MAVVLKRNTEHKNTQHIIPFEILHSQDAFHYVAHTQLADREHYSWRPYVTRRQGLLKSLPVSAASVLELRQVLSDSPSSLE